MNSMYLYTCHTNQFLINKCSIANVVRVASIRYTGMNYEMKLYHILF